jgi:hypothetical protein
MEHPFLVEEYVLPQAQREPKASRRFETMILTLSMPIDGASWGQPGLLSTKREGRPHVS